MVVILVQLQNNIITTDPELTKKFKKWTAYCESQQTSTYLFYGKNFPGKTFYYVKISSTPLCLVQYRADEECTKTQNCSQKCFHNFFNGSERNGMERIV